MNRRGAVAILAAAGLLAIGAAPALADPCVRPKGKTVSRSPDCGKPRKIEPYDPDRVRAGRNPGFIDLGNGTEVRIGGRVRMDYDVRR